MVLLQQPHPEPQEDQKLIVDIWKTKICRLHSISSIYINGTEVEHIPSFKFLGVHISQDLSWHHNTSLLLRNVQQHLYFPSRLKKINRSPQILESFYYFTVESILTNSIWYSSYMVSQMKALQRMGSPSTSLAPNYQPLNTCTTVDVFTEHTALSETPSTNFVTFPTIVWTFLLHKQWLTDNWQHNCPRLGLD